MDALSNHLIHRLDRPLAWVQTFGIVGVIVGTMIVVDEGNLLYLPVGWVLGFVIGGLFGLVPGLVIWLIFRCIGGLDTPVARPDVWAMNLKCLQCGWQTSPDGPYPRRYLFAVPETCPECGGEVAPIVPGCPRCQTPKLKGESIARDVLAQVRVPRSLRGFLRGDLRCSNCRCDYDRWGREVLT